MTRPLPEHTRKRSTLSQTWVSCALKWDEGMFKALDRCARADLTVKQAMDYLGVSDHSLARGALLRLQQLLPPEGE